MSENGEKSGADRAAGAARAGESPAVARARVIALCEKYRNARDAFRWLKIDGQLPASFDYDEQARIYASAGSDEAMSKLTEVLEGGRDGRSG